MNGYVIPDGLYISEKCGIYKVVNPIGEIYVGASRNIPERVREYKRAASTSGNLKKSIFKHGRKNHKFYLIMELPEDVTEADIRKWERYFIKKFKSKGAVLLNVRPGGEGQSLTGRQKTSETIKLNNSIGMYYQNKTT